MKNFRSEEMQLMQVGRASQYSEKFALRVRFISPVLILNVRTAADDAS
jgi:hypothetical protein